MTLKQFLDLIADEEAIIVIRFEVDEKDRELAFWLSDFREGYREEYSQYEVDYIGFEVDKDVVITLKNP